MIEAVGTVTKKCFFSPKMKGRESLRDCFARVRLLTARLVDKECGVVWGWLKGEIEDQVRRQKRLVGT